MKKYIDLYSQNLKNTNEFPSGKNLKGKTRKKIKYNK